MKEIYEKLLSLAVNRLCLVVAVLAILPIAIGQIIGIYWIYRFFENEGVEIQPIVFQAIGIGNACLLLLLLILFTSLMESFDKELKKTYWDMKEQRKKFKEKKNLTKG